LVMHAPYSLSLWERAGVRAFCCKRHAQQIIG
jgi:hypothetical protein